MSTLHTVNKSPFTYTTLTSCLAICGSEDSILLLEDGVFGAINSAPCAEKLRQCIARGIKVYALEADINARGLQEKLLHDIQVTNYHQFVQLSINHRCVQSWY